MKKIVITILIFIMIAPTPASVFAGEKNWQREENGPNKIKISGECQGENVAVLVYPQNSGEPVYSAGAECENGRFSFQDDLSSWNIPEGSYRLAVGKDDSAEEVVVERNDSPNTPQSLAVIPEEPSLPSPPPAQSETFESSTPDGFTGLIEDPGFISRITQIVKSVLSSLGLFIENGIARLETLTARTIVVERLEAQVALISKAEIQNLKVSEKFEIKDQATGEIYCNWIENGEWTKVKSSCEDLAKVEQPIEQSQAPSPEGEVLDQEILVESEAQESATSTIGEEL